MSKNIIEFDVSIGRTKPENIVHAENPCPFCRPETLTDIIEVDGDMIFLKNKYNVIENADQFVLVECKDCNIDMPDYSSDYMEKVIAFGMKHWQKLLASKKYTAVAFFKNHGMLSGGTMRHAHMQVVGFFKAKPELFYEDGSFEGREIASKNGVTLNSATKPRLGFGEFNIVAEEKYVIRTMSDFIQTVLQYYRENLRTSRDSYNIFFYEEKGFVRVKLMPRYPTSPLFVGYDLRIFPKNSDDVIAKIREMLTLKKII